LGRSVLELLAEVSDALAERPVRHTDLPTIWRCVADQVAQNRWQQSDSILLVDDADSASGQMMTALARLIDIDPSPEARWTVILASQPGRMGQLAERLISRVALRVDLVSWQPEETMEYVRKTVAAAGGNAAIFAEESLRALHEAAGGIPRRVNQLVDLALVAGAGQQLQQLDAETIESAAELAVV
jgi:general secretion pathway protein A